MCSIDALCSREAPGVYGPEPLGPVLDVPNGDGVAWNAVVRWALDRLERFRVHYPVDPNIGSRGLGPWRFGHAELCALPGIQIRRCGDCEIFEGQASAEAVELLARLCVYPLDDDHGYDAREILMAYVLTTGDGSMVELRYINEFVCYPATGEVEAELAELIAASGTQPYVPERITNASVKASRLAARGR